MEIYKLTMWVAKTTYGKEEVDQGERTLERLLSEEDEVEETNSYIDIEYVPVKVVITEKKLLSLGYMFSVFVEGRGILRLVFEDGSNIDLVDEPGLEETIINAISGNGNI